MEKNKNNHIRWLGIRLTKKRAIYLTVISSIGSSFFAVAIGFLFVKNDFYFKQRY